MMASAASPNRAALEGWPIACLQSPLLRRSIAVAAEVIQAGGLPNEQSLLNGSDLGVNAVQPLLQFGPVLDRLWCSAPVTGFFRRPLMDSNHRLIASNFGSATPSQSCISARMLISGGTLQTLLVSWLVCRLLSSLPAATTCKCSRLREPLPSSRRRRSNLEWRWTQCRIAEMRVKQSN